MPFDTTSWCRWTCPFASTRALMQCCEGLLECDDSCVRRPNPTRFGRMDHVTSRHVWKIALLASRASSNAAPRMYLQSVHVCPITLHHSSTLRHVSCLSFGVSHQCHPQKSNAKSAAIESLPVCPDSRCRAPPRRAVVLLESVEGTATEALPRSMAWMQAR